MKVRIVESVEELGRMGADLVAGVVEGDSTAVLGVATGSSPIAIYAELAERVAAGSLDLSGLRGFALDEYVGLPVEHEQSYARFIRTRIEEPLGLFPGAIRVPDGLAADLDGAAAAFDAAIAAAGGVDLQILGVGANGHIGFNEPGSSLGSRTRVKTLAARTRADNARFFSDQRDVPPLCVTQGLATISAARHVLLAAAGEAKADAVAAVVEGPVTTMWPGSVLQHHPRVTVIVDEAAASRLALGDYYRSVAESERALEEATTPIRG